MIAIDTLVHNFLHRTGILRRFEADHAYGAACYQARRLRRHYRPWPPKRSTPGVQSRPSAAVFPRFVQHAIWRYCAQSGLDVCNGNRIDDRKSCDNIYCQIRSICDRIVLNNS